MKTLRLHAEDNVIIALENLKAGTVIPDELLIVRDIVPFGHKIATCTISIGEPVYKYNQIIGFASKVIEAGKHIHNHNLTVKEFSREPKIGKNEMGPPGLKSDNQITFKGFVRPDGRVGTRNYIGVLSTVNCSASVTHHIANACRPFLSEYPNVDGVLSLTHDYGCDLSNDVSDDNVYRAFQGFIRHPNFAGVLVVGLGCEGNDVGRYFPNSSSTKNLGIYGIKIQEEGGSKATIQRGLERVKKMLAAADKAKRVPVSTSHLVVGLECGGSDAFSGITANPAMGSAVDLLVRHGGTAILSETPEIYGAEHLLIQRSATPAIGKKICELIEWWKNYLSNHNANLDNNPSPGNKAGGLTNILEKSLGAVTKAGTTSLNAVYRYAQTVDSKGLVFMDTPGYDPTSITGMIAGGANMICFSTGRGTGYGCKPVPCLKLASTSKLFKRMPDDMDINCGMILEGKATVSQMGEQIFKQIIASASGEETKNELLITGDHEFVPWYTGATL